MHAGSVAMHIADARASASPLSTAGDTVSRSTTRSHSPSSISARGFVSSGPSSVGDDDMNMDMQDALEKQLMKEG